MELMVYFFGALNSHNPLGFKAIKQQQPQPYQEEMHHKPLLLHSLGL
jgi:hypothetical protein